MLHQSSLFSAATTSSTYYLSFAIAGIFLLWTQRRRFSEPYPPGPPADPIVGHLRVLPKSSPEVAFREMSKTYGDILYFHIPGRSYLVLNSLKAATELLDQRSGIYSDRVRLPLYKLMGWDVTLGFMPYGKRFQKHRRLLNEYLNEKKCATYWPLQTQYARRLLVRLLENSDNWMQHSDRFSAEIIAKITYGKDLVDNDPYLELCKKAADTVASCGSPGATIVDFLPFLQHFPSWFPGTYYVYKARSFREEMHKTPFEHVIRQMSEGTAQRSYVSYHLEQLHGTTPDEEHIEDLQGSACQMFGAGAETTSSALEFFIFDMVKFPEVQKKAQKEIDGTIGNSRLPEFNDLGSLPYVQAVIWEVLRWSTVAPMGIPHRSTEDDIYKGMYIPKGTVVIANLYSILRDKTIYSNPDTFNPNRYLHKPEGTGEPHPTGHFGFGRRICAGQHLAGASLFIAIVSILATLDISRAYDEGANEIVPEETVDTGLSSHPKPFPCIIRPRDKTREILIRQAQPWDEK